MTAASKLKHASLYPYDAPDEWWNSIGGAPPKATDWAHVAARGVIADLEDRHTIKRGFENIDEETRIEIVGALAEIIRLAERQREAA
jgi:hypothetical protein